MNKVYKTRHGKVEMRCLNLVATNETLVVAPKYKGERVQIFVEGTIAEQIATDKKLRSKAYKLLKKDYEDFRTSLVN